MPRVFVCGEEWPRYRCLTKKSASWEGGRAARHEVLDAPLAPFPMCAFLAEVLDAFMSHLSLLGSNKYTNLRKRRGGSGLCNPHANLCSRYRFISR